VDWTEEPVFIMEENINKKTLIISDVGEYIGFESYEEILRNT